MVIAHSDVVEVLSRLADEENIQAAVKETMKGGLIAGLTCAAGGLLLGPAGLAVGGAVGGGISYALAKDKFKPLSQV